MKILRITQVKSNTLCDFCIYSIIAYHMKVKSKPLKTIHRKEYEALIEKLINARKECNLTQKQAGDKLGWRQDYISKLESKQRRVDILELYDLANIYKKDITHFISHLK